MVTYGTDQTRSPRPPERGARPPSSARRRWSGSGRQGKTYFKMGIAIHYGRVYLARFIADEETVQTTVIGRNVNLAGRLSLRGQEADRGGRGRTSPRPAGPTARLRAARHRRRARASSSTRASPSAATPWSSSRTTCPWSTGRAAIEFTDEPAAPPDRVPLRGRREVQGRPLEPARLRGRLPRRS